MNLHGVRVLRRELRFLLLLYLLLEARGLGLGIQPRVGWPGWDTNPCRMTGMNLHGAGVLRRELRFLLRLQLLL